jgi:hypothetical protein
MEGMVRFAVNRSNGRLNNDSEIFGFCGVHFEARF